MIKALLTFVMIGAIIMNTDDAISSEKKIEQTAHNFPFKYLDGTKLDLASFKGKVILIVNTASKCGFTPQYADLEKIYQQYKNNGLVIIGVPSNDFGGQEPGTAKEVTTFCQLNYGVTLPMTQKESVSGEQAHPFYRWAKETLGVGAAPKWNFHKYLIDRRGMLIDYFYSTTSPQSDRFKKAIEKALNENSATAFK
jgi:glutathione peroxidase